MSQCTQNVPEISTAVHVERMDNTMWAEWQDRWP